MHLERVLGSEARIKVLRTLLQEALPQLPASGLVEETGKSQGGVHKALKELEGTGVVRAHKRGRTYYYGVNPEHPYATVLQDLFHRERTKDNVGHLFPTYWNHLEDVVSGLIRKRTLEFILLYGSLLRPPIRPGADIDLLAVVDGDDEESMEVPGDHRKVLGHEISLLVLRLDEIAEKARRGDRFIEGVLERNVVLYRGPDAHAPWLRTSATPGPR